MVLTVQIMDGYFFILKVKPAYKILSKIWITSMKTDVLYCLFSWHYAEVTKFKTTLNVKINTYF